MRTIFTYWFIPIENIEQYRLSELTKLGIKFTDKVNDKNILELNKQIGWKSVFYHGIIFTGPFSKSQTLLDFIEKTNISPKKIIVFDKIKSELQQIDSQLRRFRIDVYNILYLGARELKGEPDPNIVKLQQKTLLEKNEIFRKIYHTKGFEFTEIYGRYLRFAEEIRPYVCDTAVKLSEEMHKKRSILFEGAQGTHLDVDHGTSSLSGMGHGDWGLGIVEAFGPEDMLGPQA